jgi:antitoxin YefM
MYIYPYRGAAPAMSHVSYTDFRQNLARYMDEVCNSGGPLHVTRQKGRSVVVLSEEEFDEWMETIHLLRGPANAQRLLESIAAANAGKLHEHEPIEEQ